MTNGDFAPPPPPGDGPQPPPTPPAFAGSSTPPPPPPPPGLTPPPGYTPYQTGPTPVSGTVSRVGGIAKASMIFVGLAGAIGLLNAILIQPVQDEAADLIAGRITVDEFDDSYASVQAIQLVSTVVSLVAAVVSVIWMFRIAKNVRVHGRRTTWAPLFAVFGWVLPPFLYVIPMLQLRELWKASDPDSPAGTEAWKSSPGNPLVFAWFIAQGVIPAVIFALTVGATISTFLDSAGEDASVLAAEAVESASSYSLIGGIVTAIAAVLWILLVKQLTSRHTTLTGER